MFDTRLEANTFFPSSFVAFPGSALSSTFPSLKGPPCPGLPREMTVSSPGLWVLELRGPDFPGTCPIGPEGMEKTDVCPPLVQGASTLLHIGPWLAPPTVLPLSFRNPGEVIASSLTTSSVSEGTESCFWQGGYWVSGCTHSSMSLVARSHGCDSAFQTQEAELMEPQILLLVCVF